MDTEKKSLTALEQADLRASKQIVSGLRISRDEEESVIIAKQVHIPSYHVWTNKDLHNKAKEIYGDTLDKKYHILAGTYIFDESLVTVEWVKEQMEEVGLTNKDLKKQLGMTPNALSLLFNKKRPFSRQMKTMFFYYIMAMGGGKLSYNKRQKDHIEFTKLYDENEQLKARVKELEDKLEGKGGE